jgi:hypothetical protein
VIIAKKNITDKVFINVFDLNCLLHSFALGKLSRYFHSRKRTMAKKETHFSSSGTELIGVRGRNDGSVFPSS